MKKLTDKERKEKAKKANGYKPLPLDTKGADVDLKNRFILR